MPTCVPSSTNLFPPPKKFEAPLKRLERPRKNWAWATPTRRTAIARESGTSGLMTLAVAGVAARGTCGSGVTFRATGPTKSSVGEPLLPRARGGTGDGDTSSAVRLSVCPHATDAATHSLSLSVAPSRSIYVHSIHPESMQCPMVNTGQTSEAQPPLLLYPLRVNTTSVASSPLLPRSLASVASASHLASSHLNTAHAGRSYLCVCTLRTGRTEMDL